MKSYPSKSSLQSVKSLIENMATLPVTDAMTSSFYMGCSDFNDT